VPAPPSEPGVVWPVPASPITISSVAGRASAEKQAQDMAPPPPPPPPLPLVVAAPAAPPPPAPIHSIQTTEAPLGIVYVPLAINLSKNFLFTSPLILPAPYSYFTSSSSTSAALLTACSATSSTAATWRTSYPSCTSGTISITTTATSTIPTTKLTGCAIIPNCVCT